MQQMTAMTARITLLNATYEPLNHNVPLHRAIKLLHLGKAEIIDADDDVFITSAGGDVMWPFPRTLRLLRYVKVAYDRLYGPPQVSKRGVLIRDNYACGYCGEHANTVDHVHPRSKGGRSVWTNLVAACQECNNRKRNRTPEDAGMPLKVTPYAPKRKSVARNFG